MLGYTIARMTNYIIWDWNGTLLDDVGAAVAALNRMLVTRGVPCTTREYYRANFGFPVRPFYEKLGVDLAHEDWDRICEDFHRFISEEPDQHPRPEAAPALERALSRGFRNCILSALREDILRRDVSAAGLMRYFDEVYGVDNLDGATKLSRGRDLFACLDAKGEVGKRYLIGDTLHDAEVACALGARCVLVEGGHQNAERLAASGCPVAPSLLGALDIIFHESED